MWDFIMYFMVFLFVVFVLFKLIKRFLAIRKIKKIRYYINDQHHLHIYVGIPNISYMRIFEIYPTYTLTKDKYPDLSIINIFWRKKVNSFKNSTLIIINTIIFYYVTHTSEFLSVPIDLIVVYFLIGIFLLSVLNLGILYFRIEHGYYGNNRKETIEIINFIISQSENIDFTDGDGLKKIFSKEDLKEFQENWVGDWQGVRK